MSLQENSQLFKPLNGTAKIAECAIFLLLLAPVTVHERVAGKVDETAMLAYRKEAIGPISKRSKGQLVEFLRVNQKKVLE